MAIEILYLSNRWQCCQLTKPMNFAIILTMSKVLVPFLIYPFFVFFIYIWIIEKFFICFELLLFISIIFITEEEYTELRSSAKMFGID